MGTDIHWQTQARKSDAWVDIEDKFEGNRNYMLFAWLGDVRNGYGFAGTATHHPLTPLQSSRGVPKDYVAKEEYELGDHSFGWLTGAEIVEGAKVLPLVTRYGVVDRDFFDAWDGKSAPASWYPMISGPGIVINESFAVDDKTTHVSVKWQSNVREELAYFIDEIQRLVDEHGEIRLVFGFDS